MVFSLANRNNLSATNTNSSGKKQSRILYITSRQLRFGSGEDGDAMLLRLQRILDSNSSGSTNKSKNNVLLALKELEEEEGLRFNMAYERRPFFLKG